jgi:alanine-alpha-ketoisovalerate/valine-pyruvate aminotransferase
MRRAFGLPAQSACCCLPPVLLLAYGAKVNATETSVSVEVEVNVIVAAFEDGYRLDFHSLAVKDAVDLHCVERPCEFP